MTSLQIRYEGLTMTIPCHVCDRYDMRLGADV